MPPMKYPSSRSLIAMMGAGITALLAIVFLAYEPLSQPSPPAHQDVREKPVPSLNCVFYDFTRASIVVGFDFAATLSEGAPPRFEERAKASRDGNQTIFEVGDRPVWAYAQDDDGHPTITSPDGATRVVLYGLKLDAVGAFFIEAGLRSNEYRNLNGQCQQANFGGALASMSKESSPVAQ